MDLATGVGLVGGIGVVFTLIMIDGGNLAAYFDKHAVIVIFGGSVMATIIRFPFSTIAHGVPMGLRYAFTMRAGKPHDLIEEIARIADAVRKSGPIALESMEISDPFRLGARATSPTATTAPSSATPWSATATPSSCISTRARRSTGPSATAPRPGA